MYGSEKFIPAECIHCDSVIRLAVGTPLDSFVRCPVCQKPVKARLLLAGDDAPIAAPIEAGHPDLPVDSDRTKESTTPSGDRPAASGAGLSSGQAEGQKPSTESSPTDSVAANRPAAAAPSGNLKQRLPAAMTKLRHKSRRSSSESSASDSDVSQSSRPAEEPKQDSADNFTSREKVTASTKPDASDSVSEPQSPQSDLSEKKPLDPRFVSVADSSSDDLQVSESSSRDRSRSSSRSSSGDRSKRLESDRGWNNIGVDGRPIKKSRRPLKELEDHDGGEGSWRELVMIMLGGIISLPITQICVWWLADVDPLALGPPTSRVVPQVVPARFRDVEVESMMQQVEDEDASQPQSSSSTDDTNEAPGEVA